LKRHLPVTIQQDRVARICGLRPNGFIVIGETEAPRENTDISDLYEAVQAESHKGDATRGDA